MTEDDKALVDRLRNDAQWVEIEFDRVEQMTLTTAADRIEALIAENERLRYELRCIFEDYERCMADEWAADVREALGETK